MFINNGIYFVFWLLFFDRFQEIRGYQIEQIFLLFAIVALGWGLAFTFAGNAPRLAELIAQGRLDYYLTLPRPVLPHLLFSRMDPFNVGDLTFSVIAYLFTGRFDPLSIVLFLGCSVLVAVIFVAFYALAGCMSFFIGNAAQWSFYTANTLLTFALYPFGLFQGAVRLILYTLIPAAFVGAVPVKVVETHSFTLFGALAGGGADQRGCTGDRVPGRAAAVRVRQRDQREYLNRRDAEIAEIFKGKRENDRFHLIRICLPSDTTGPCAGGHAAR